MTTLKIECRKFSPNIFNKTKCQNCFRTKEGHSAEALECNRASRKVSKCGYLFVAPDWDFSVSINRTKRWQRRWFVLYDDGELTYSVDEHPDTVPQAVIDMNKVVEVTDAEDVTGNQFAIAITAPEKVHFVKGTSREESRWWFDVLSSLPRNNNNGRGKHKRNATFPGGTATTTSLTIISDHKTPSLGDQDPSVNLVSRPRFLSSSAETCHRKDWSWLQIDPNDEDVFPTKDCDDVSAEDLLIDCDENIDTTNALNKLIASTVACFSNGSSLLRTKQESLGLDCEPKDLDSGDIVDCNTKKARSRRYLKREIRGMRSQRSRSDGVAKMIPGHMQDNIGPRSHNENPVYLLLSEAQNRYCGSLDRLKHNSSMMSPLPNRRRHTSDLESISPGRGLTDQKDAVKPLMKTTLKKSESLMNIASELSPEMRNRISELKRNHSYKGSPAMYRDQLCGSHSQNKTSSTFITAIRPVRDTDPKPQVHGDSDKNSNSSSWDAGVDICTQDLLMKKGWLLRQTLSKEWSRHWFVLKNASLTYYRDPSAEDCGILDGVLDLNQVTSIEEMEMDKNFAFSLVMWDCKKHILSAISATMRSSWIKAIQRASNLWDSESRKDFVKEELVIPDRSIHVTDSKNSEKSQSTLPASQVILPEQEKTHDLSSSDDQSEYFSIIDEEEVIERTASPRTLPPSPPVNRTPMSLVKERARSRANSYSVPIRQNSTPILTEGSQLKQVKSADSINSDSSSSCAQDSIQSCELSQVPGNQVKQKTVLGEENSQLLALQSHCKDLEKQLEVKTKEVNSKVMDLDAFRKLKAAYQILMDQRKNLKKATAEDEKSSAVDNTLDSSSYRLKYELLKAKYIQDRMDWENKYKKEKSHCLKDSNFDSYIKILNKTKQAVNELKENLFTASGAPVLSVTTSEEIRQLCHEMERISPSSEKLKRDSDYKKLRKMAAELQVLCRHKQQKFEEEQSKCSSLNSELEKQNNTIHSLQQELQSLRNEYVNILQPIKPQNELSSDNATQGTVKTATSCTLCKPLNSKLILAKQEIQKLKKDVKDSHMAFDSLEIHCFQLKQDMKSKEENHQSQMNLMTARVDDLTSKYTVSERNLRQVKHKVGKLESRQERRRSSLKNKETLSLSKECEAKLFELECKIAGIEDELKDDKPQQRRDFSVSSENHSELNELEIDPDKLLQKRLSQDSTTSGSDNTGLLLRLHTLGMRVKNASYVVEKQAVETSEENDIMDKPKICLQVRNEEESNVQEEGAEDWSTLSYATSLTDLQALDGLDNDLPCTFNECFQCIEQKLDCLLSWAKTAINFVQKQDVSLVDYFQNSNVTNKDGLTLSSDVIEVLENLPDLKFDDVPCNAGGFEMIKLCYKTLLVLETSRVLQKIMHCESSAVLEKLCVCNLAFKFIQNHFDKLNDSENKSLSGIEDCCSLVEKLVSVSSAPYDAFLNDTMEDFSQISQHPLNRISIIKEFCSQLLHLLEDAKHSQFLAIYNILEDVPVQDAEMSKQRTSSFADNLLELDPLLSNIATMLNCFFQVAEDQLCNPLQQNLSLLVIENMAWNSWSTNTRKLLKLELYSSVEELKKLFPQAREGSLFPFGFNDALYKKIVFASAELARISLLRVITQSVLNFLTEQTNISGDCDYKEWINHLHDNIYCKALSVAHGDVFHNTCSSTFETSFFNHILEAGAREIKIAEQMEAIRHLHQRNLELLQNEIELSRLENTRLSECCEIFEQDKVKLLDMNEQLEHASKEPRYCEKCHTLELQLQSMKELHDSNSVVLRQHKDKIEELREHLQLVIDQKDEMHVQELQKMESDLQLAHKRLNHLEIEYNEQIQSLRELYEQKMSLKQDPINEESVRRRYQNEIEQLKGLCEKGLTAMENSYRRITAELERRHKQEVTLLEAEKEKVLHEETQATFTALEVMRKAHAEELQREISRFKQEFIDKMQAAQESKTIYQRHESEIEEIKREILSISEKYSVKCLETASLEERVDLLHHQLQEANHQLFDLTARNKQLKVHLAINISQHKEAVENTDNSSDSIDNMKMMLKLKDSEVAEQRDENAELKQELHLAQMHVSMLDVQCEQLNQSLKAERRLREDEVSSLRTRLEAIIASSSPVASEESIVSASDYRGTKLSPTSKSFLFRSPSLNLQSHILGSPPRRTLTFARTKELLRSPSCPGLENAANS